MEEQGIRDTVTGFYSRFYFEEQLDVEVLRGVRRGSAFSVLLVEIDGFDAFGARHGESAIEGLLLHIAEIARDRLRSADRLFRFGDHGFAAILPETPKASAAIPAEGIREAVSQADPSELVPEAPGARVTVTVTVVGFPDDGEDAGALLSKLASHHETD